MAGLKKQYYNPKNPASFSTIEKLYKQQGDKQKTKYGRKQIDSFLQKQDAHTLHRAVRRKFPRNPYVLLAPHDFWQADLADLPSYASENNGVKYILVVVDCFTKHCWVVPCKTKTADEVCKAMKQLFKKGGKPKNLMTDKGFLSKQWAALMKNEGVNAYTSQNPDTKAAIVERLIRTLKTKIFKLFTFRKNHKYVDKLSDIVYAYNNSIHRSIGMRPVDVKPTNEDVVRERLNKRFSKSSPKLKVGDRVRISRERGVFDKGYTVNWSKEVFIVHDVVSVLRYPVYKIRDANGSVIIGTFYSQELQKLT